MSQIRQKALLLLLSLYIFHLILKFSHMTVPKWFSSHFADLLCMPILLILSQSFIAKTQQQPDFKLNLSMIVFSTIYVSIVFEFFLPLLHPSRFTKDCKDVGCYVIGALCFYFFQRITIN